MNELDPLLSTREAMEVLSGFPLRAIRQAARRNARRREGGPLDEDPRKRAAPIFGLPAEGRLFAELLQRAGRPVSALAYHEAAHAVIAWRHALRVESRHDHR